MIPDHLEAMLLLQDRLHKLGTNHPKCEFCGETNPFALEQRLIKTADGERYAIICRSRRSQYHRKPKDGQYCAISGNFDCRFPEAHHIAGRQNDPDWTVDINPNDHGILTANQRLQPAPFHPPRSKGERVGRGLMGFSDLIMLTLVRHSGKPMIGVDDFRPLYTEAYRIDPTKVGIIDLMKFGLGMMHLAGSFLIPSEEDE